MHKKPDEPCDDLPEFITGDRLLELLFPDPGQRPCGKTLLRWAKAKRIPSARLGNYRVYSPAKVKERIRELFEKEQEKVKQAK